MKMPEYPSPNNFKSAQEYNVHLNNYLRETNILTNELINSFDEAYNYGAATTINWLVKKLKIIEERIKEGQEVCFANDKYLTNKKYYEWVESRYPEIADRFQL